MAECTTTKIKKSIILSMDVRERLETMSENVSILIKQITRNDALSNQTSILLFQEYQQRLLASFQNVSNSCTKLSVMFIRPPSPKLNETGVLCSKIETATLNLASTFFQYKLEWGNCLHKEIKIAVIEVLEEVSKLGQILMTEGCRKDSQLRLRGVGKVWEQCSGRLSHDEKSAVVKVCMSQLQLLRDACQEVDDVITT
jgi:predicted DNA-binding protein